MTTLILTDPFVRKTFDIYNYISKTQSKYSFLILIKESAYFKLRLLYPKAELLFYTEASLTDRLLEKLSKHPNTTFIYIPFEEDTTLEFIATELHGKLKNLRCLLPSTATYQMVRNKKLFASFCETHHLPIPKTYLGSEIQHITSERFEPLIAKPKIGSGAVGHIHIDGIQDLYKLDQIEAEQYIIQEKLNNPTEVEGGFYLAKDGVLVSYYGHKRIRTYPPEGGVTVYSAYQENDTLRKLGSKILEKLEWSGLTMIEFLWDDKKEEYKIIEVNPRLWGSILLSEFSGANLVLNYIKLCEGEALGASPIKSQAKIRWLIPYDLIHYLKSGFKIAGFWNFDKSNTCYINMSYASFGRSFLWHLFSMFDLGKFKKLIKKMKRG